MMERASGVELRGLGVLGLRFRGCGGFRVQVQALWGLGALRGFGV